MDRKQQPAVPPAPFVHPNVDPRTAAYQAGITARRAGGAAKDPDPVGGGPPPAIPRLDGTAHPGLTMEQHARAERPAPRMPGGPQPGGIVEQATLPQQALPKAAPERAIAVTGGRGRGFLRVDDAPLGHTLRCRRALVAGQGAAWDLRPGVCCAGACAHAGSGLVCSARNLFLGDLSGASVVGHRRASGAAPLWRSIAARVCRLRRIDRNRRIACDGAPVAASQVSLPVPVAVRRRAAIGSQN